MTWDYGLGEPLKEYLALLDSVRDYPGQHVDRTIAIWRIRERRHLTWRAIGDLFTLSAERARQIAKTYSPVNSLGVPRMGWVDVDGYKDLATLLGRLGEPK